MSRGFLLRMGTFFFLLACGHTRRRRDSAFDAIDAAQRFLLEAPDECLGYLAVGRRALGLEQDFSVPSDQLSPEILVQPPSIAHEAPVLLGGLLADARSEEHTSELQS